MNLTTKGRYAVMAMVDLAMQKTDKPVSLSDIAERQGITLNYLEQIFMKLRRAGIVKSVRGPGGGYVMNSKGSDIIISDIVTAVDESIKMTRCKDGHSCLGENAKCVTHKLWVGLGKQIDNYLSAITLADVCGNSDNLVNKQKVVSIKNG
ncbi:Rrf2 family transcriptional regulator [Rickettsiales bacterium]|nr:Rrf2 family transcriptional regulator [Rickettsiales bacterium]